MNRQRILYYQLEIDHLYNKYKCKENNRNKVIDNDIDEILNKKLCGIFYDEFTTIIEEQLCCIKETDSLLVFDELETFNNFTIYI